MKRSQVALIILASGAGAVRLEAQTTRCDLSSQGPAIEELVNGVSIRRGSGGITVVCRSRNITLVADSAEMIGDNRVDLFGRVHYQEPSRIDLRSDLLTYFLAEERIHVRGHVVATLPSGSTLVGPEATLLRAAPRIRTIDEITAISKPTVTVVAKGDSGKPVVVNANTIYMRGDSVIYASRAVVITRPDLVARGDSAFVDGRTGTETIRLMFTPSVEGLQGRKFRLEGQIIDAYSKQRKLEQVIARGKAHAKSEDMDIVADTIDLRMSNDAMERAIAWSRGTQAKATSPSQVITADSLDVVMPKQKVQVVYAVGNARADAVPDTTRFRTKERDWLRGAVVTAWFDSAATKDTSSTPPIQRILAVHPMDSAQAFYHLTAADTAVREPALSYVRGREIRLDFDKRRITMVTVRDSVSGVYLEPRRPDTTRARPDSAKAGQAGAGATVPTRPPASAPVRRPPAFDLPRPRGR